MSSRWTSQFLFGHCCAAEQADEVAPSHRQPPDKGSLPHRQLGGCSASQQNLTTDGSYGSCVEGTHGSRDFFGFLLAVGCKSCVRPVCAVLMTAGPDVIRRSGPYQTLA